jgi:hypothetical protein|tara:strand:- start:50 stop:532 length:483 start_codon:yes stop_codon:yes gene_type:complete
MGSNGARGGGSNRYEPPKKKNPVIEFVKGGGIAGAVIRGVTGAIKTAKTKSKQNTMDYEGQAAGVTPMRSPSNFTSNRGNGNNNSNAVVPLATVASTSPTTAEVSQSAATDVVSTESIDDILLKKKKTKATGRSMTILTSSKGIKSDEGLILGKKSLLGA